MQKAINAALVGPQEQVAALDYQRSASSVRAALGDLKPQVALSVQAQANSPYSASNKIGAVAGPALALTLPTGQGVTTISLGAAARTPGYSQSLGAQASLSTRIPLLAGPDTRQTAAEHDLAAAQAAYQARQQQIVIDAINAYNGALQAEEALLLATQARQLAELDYQLGQEQFQRGTLSSTDLYRLRAALNSAQNSELSAKHALEDSRSAMANIWGADTPDISLSTISGDEQSAPALFHVNGPAAPTNGQASAQNSGTDVDPASDPAYIEAWTTLALQRRSDVQLARENVDLANAALQKAMAVADKEIAFVAGATFPKEITETYVDERINVTAGVQATFYLQNPRRTESVVAAEAALARAKADLANLEQQVKRSIPVAVHRIVEIEQSIAQARMQLRQDEMTLAVVKERVAQGLAITRDIAAQELVIAQQASYLRRLEGQRIVAYVSLWQTAGLNAVELHYPAL